MFFLVFKYAFFYFDIICKIVNKIKYVLFLYFKKQLIFVNIRKYGSMNKY